MFNRRLLINSGGTPPQTYSVLEVHVDTADGGHISSARVEITYDGKSNTANTDNKGIALFSNIPTGEEISYIISALGYNTASGIWIIDTDVEYETEYVILSPLVNYDFKLTVGLDYNDELGEYQSGFFINNVGRISPAQFKQHQISQVGTEVVIDVGTGVIMINTLNVTLVGDTRSDISQITIYIADSMYTLNNVKYINNKTYYYIEMNQDTTIFSYFDKMDGETVDIQLIDE